MKPPRYRVWCLSWEDSEEDGTDVIAYDFLNHDPSKEDRRAIYMSYVRPLDAAEAYADHAHSNRDGCECTWPLTFRVKCPDGSLVDFEVDREIVPEFTAREIKNTPATIEGLHVFTNHTDTVVAKDLADAQAIVEAHYESTFDAEGWTLDEWGQVDDDAVVTICNLHDRGPDDKLSLTARQWVERDGRCFLGSTEW